MNKMSVKKAEPEMGDKTIASKTARNTLQEGAASFPIWTLIVDEPPNRVYRLGSKL